MKLKTLLLCVASTLVITGCGPAPKTTEPQKDLDGIEAKLYDAFDKTARSASAAELPLEVEEEPKSKVVASKSFNPGEGSYDVITYQSRNISMSVRYMSLFLKNIVADNNYTFTGKVEDCSMTEETYDGQSQKITNTFDVKMKITADEQENRITAIYYSTERGDTSGFGTSYIRFELGYDFEEGNLERYVVAGVMGVPQYFLYDGENLKSLRTDSLNYMQFAEEIVAEGDSFKTQTAEVSGHDYTAAYQRAYNELMVNELSRDAFLYEFVNSSEYGKSIYKDTNLFVDVSGTLTNNGKNINANETHKPVDSYGAIKYEGETNNSIALGGESTLSVTVTNFGWNLYYMVFANEKSCVKESYSEELDRLKMEYEGVIECVMNPTNSYTTNLSFTLVTTTYGFLSEITWNEETVFMMDGQTYNVSVSAHLTFTNYVGESKQEEYSTVTEDEWSVAFNKLTCKGSIITTKEFDGQTTDVSICEVGENIFHYSSTAVGASEYYYVRDNKETFVVTNGNQDKVFKRTDISEDEYMNMWYELTYQNIFDYCTFVYDKEIDGYKQLKQSPITITKNGMAFVYTNAQILFSNKHISEISFNLSILDSNQVERASYEIDITVEYDNNLVINLPSYQQDVDSGDLPLIH